MGNLSEAGAAAMAQCLAMVRGEYEPAKALWDGEFSEKERRVFLVAARLPDALRFRVWRELTPAARGELKRVMVRFHRRFSGLLARVVCEGEGA
jgi:hypothetical protein